MPESDFAFLGELERLEKAGTKGVWTWEPGYLIGGDPKLPVGPTVYAGRGEGHGFNLFGRLDPTWSYLRTEDLDLACAARNALPRLIALARLAVEARYIVGKATEHLGIVEEEGQAWLDRLSAAIPEPDGEKEKR